ncbi:MAG: hypothetical protein LW865_13110 [Betaproteobacteria bacterium]|jgi:hypothetical protein|nr:hypothetical protein [Betaproteobacteria bacterium]
MKKAIALIAVGVLAIVLMYSVIGSTSVSSVNSLASSNQAKIANATN